MTCYDVYLLLTHSSHNRKKIVINKLKQHLDVDKSNYKSKE